MSVEELRALPWSPGPKMSRTDWHKFVKVCLPKFWADRGGQPVAMSSIDFSSKKHGRLR